MTGSIGRVNSVLHQNNSVVDHVKDHCRGKLACFLEQDGIGGAEQSDWKPRKSRMVDRKKSRATNNGPPATPFTIQGPVEKTAEQILFRKWSDANGHDGVGDS